jgi:cob(I)alamin adenosyltransferase
MPRLGEWGPMKIYTKKGDKGQTGLFGGGDFPKDDLRIAAYGTVDELNSVVGLVLSHGVTSEIHSPLIEVQRELFTLGAELATLKPSPAMVKGYLQESHVMALEEQIDWWEKDLAPLKKFILPGGSVTAAHLHLARTVCRRAERALVTLHQQQGLRSEVLKYINRLSDWFFVLARFANHLAKQEDVLWEGISK